MTGYKCWGTRMEEVCIYLDADNPQDAANKAFKAFKRDDEGVQFEGYSIDEDIAVQEKNDGEYGDEIIITKQ